MNRSYMIYIAIFFLGFVLCRLKNNFVDYWPENGATFQNITWQIPLVDSTLVLQRQNGNWIIPSPPSDAELTITDSEHKNSKEQPYEELIGRSDQEVHHYTGVIRREFYRFNKEGVLLLGYETFGPLNELTYFEPPLVLLPAILPTSHTPSVQEVSTKIWNDNNKESRSSQQRRLRLTKIQDGLAILDSVVVPAILCRMTLSLDTQIRYGESDLIIPDALSVQNMILFLAGVGPVLEWSITKQSVEHNIKSYRESIEKNHTLARSVDEEECTIEVTLHRKK